MKNFEEQLKKLPSKPGVYIMHDKDGVIIYVGKAKSLKNRVRQYFHSPKNHNLKTLKMVSCIDSFEYIICQSELEALVLECNLIKKHRPKYNIMLKDDKNYPYVKLTLNEEYPKMQYVRKIEKDGAKYFGPYPSGFSVKGTMELLKNIFRIQHCNKTFPRDIGKSRPCLYHYMGKCIAPCTGKIDPKEYRKLFLDIDKFLSGDGAALSKELERKMLEASSREDFETAADLRDKYLSVKHLNESQKVISAKDDDTDVFSICAVDSLSCVEVFFIRGGKMLGRNSFDISNYDVLDEARSLEEFVTQYYTNGSFIPKNILLSHEIEGMEALCEYLERERGNKVIVSVPKRGVKKELVNMAQINAKNFIEQKKTEQIKRKLEKNSLIELASLLGLEVIPDRIEAYDISNTAGSENVASMVVFENGKSAKKEYRHFKMETVGADDVGCMRETIYRRFTHEERKKDSHFLNLPDLLLIDGGLNQLNAAKKVLEELNIDIPVYSMIKDDRHRTRALVSLDGEIAINPVKSVFNLITNIQDEAHRFAIEYHRKLRAKKSMKSVLDDIEGIGKKRKEALLKHFKSIEKIKNATVEELKEAEDIGKDTAEKVYDFFHTKKGM